MQLINYTGQYAEDPAREAANLLVFTKQTRLRMDPEQMDSVRAMSYDKILEELEYMANTIPSSWEFIQYVFLINDVTRAYTHQFVRTRTGSYAQQTMRVLDVEGWDYGTGPSIESDPIAKSIYSNSMRLTAQVYRDLIDMGAKIEDARGVLPTNIHTNIVARFDLRTIAETARKRASSRTQGEYREVMEGMKKAILAVHPWTSLFLERTFDVSAANLETMLQLHIGDPGERTKALKLLDQLRAAA